MVSLSTDEFAVSDEGEISGYISEFEGVYDGFRLRYSDLLQMLKMIEASHDDFDGDRLCNNLEIIVEYARENEKVNDEVFLSLTKLTDHIGLEIKRDRELENKTFETINASQSVLEAMKSYDSKIEESQGMVRRFQT